MVGGGIPVMVAGQEEPTAGCSDRLGSSTAVLMAVPSMEPIKHTIIIRCLAVMNALTRAAAAEEVSSVGAGKALGVAIASLCLRLPAGHLRHGLQAAEQRRKTACRACAYGADDQGTALAGGGQPRLRLTQRRFTVHGSLARRVEGALDLRHSGHGRARPHHADAGRLVGGVRGRRLAHHRRQGADRRDHTGPGSGRERLPRARRGRNKARGRTAQANRILAI